MYFSIGLFKDTLVIKNHPILGFIQPLDFQHKSFSTKPQNYIFNIYSHYVNAQMSVNNDPFRVSAQTCIVIILDVVTLSQGYRLKTPSSFYVSTSRILTQGEQFSLLFAEMVKE